jgi:hypothetical protein
MGICENEFRLPVVPVSHLVHEQIKHFISSL